MAPGRWATAAAEDYGKFALEAAKLMKWTDPSIKLIAAGSSNFGARHRLDRLEPHRPRPSQESRRLSRHSHVRRQPRERLRRLHGQLGRPRPAHQDHRGHHRRRARRAEPRAAKSTSPGTSGTSGIARAATQQRGRRILEERYNLEDALVVATFLNSFVNHAHIIKMANMAQLVNVIAPMFTNDQGMFLQTIYHPLALFANNTKGKALGLFVDSPKYKSDALRRRSVPRRLRGVSKTARSSSTS